ncbi:DUF4270 family protein [Coprobacter tertius]|uniref:DUF4270 domain-containing protein n=1 Tax=Coprobacter tertius TaxID=2944915 RepID=A0ABT1MJ23_9BACT|nr:DUF4270 family protein [Coprobacter tertius]MCP9611241.1 DUF4270 domain-containing protein [Coprobacter tertius]
MKLHWLLPFALIATMISCEDDLDQIGSSIDSSVITISVDSTFSKKVKTQSISCENIPNRTLTQMIGSLNIPDFGSVKAGYLTQFIYLSSIDTIEWANIDSLVLSMGFKDSKFWGDSLAPMQLSVYKLNKKLETPLYSNLDPNNYYDQSNDFLNKTSYSASKLSIPDSLTTTGAKYIDTKLPQSFAKFLYDKFKEDPSAFTDIDRLPDIFPGLYIKNSYGIGSLINIEQSVISWYHHRTVKAYDGVTDSIIPYITHGFSVNNMVPTVNHIERTIAPKVENLIAQGKTIIQAPVGYNAQITIPTREIINTYLKTKETQGNIAMLNGITLSVPIVKPAKNDYGVIPPPYLLFIRKQGESTDQDGNKVEMDLNKFFTKRLLTDSKNYFYATYNSNTHSYDFGNIRDFFTTIMGNDAKYDQPETWFLNGSHPEYNEEILLVPINIETKTVINEYYQQVTVVSSISPYIAYPAQAEIDTENIKLKLIYSSIN